MFPEHRCTERCCVNPPNNPDAKSYNTNGVSNAAEADAEANLIDHVAID
jgi:hypothetical protein